MYVQRGIYSLFEKMQSVTGSIALVGPRQAGKTTFLKHHMEKHHASYILLDDPDIKLVFDEDVKKFEMKYIEAYDLAILDEVQHCQDAGQKLKYLIDTGRRLWITSSSETIFSAEVLSYLVERVSIFRLYPFDFDEFLRAKGQEVLMRSIQERMVWEHMTYGGYPRVVLTKDHETKVQTLKNLYETMMLKDVRTSFTIEKTTEMERCVTYLALNTGGVVNYENLGKMLRLRYETLKRYLDALEKSYLTISVFPFFRNKSKELVKRPKIYFLDTGMRNSIADEFRAEPNSHVFENYVLSELMKIGVRPKYWRTKGGAEVDFIIETKGLVIPVEVKLRNEPGKIPRSIRSFIRTYGPERAFIVAYWSQEGTMEVDGCRVAFTNIIGLREGIKGLDNTPD